MTSIRASRGKIHTEAGLRDGVVDAKWLPSPYMPPSQTGVTRPQIRCPRLFWHLKAALVYIIPSIRASCGKIHTEAGLSH